MEYQIEIVEGHIVRIQYTAPEGFSQIWNIYLENIFWGGKITFPMHVTGNAVDRILWLKDLSDEEFRKTGEFRAKGPSTGVVCVYTGKKRDEMYFIMFTNRGQMYKRFVHYSHRAEKVCLWREYFDIVFQGCIYSDKAKDFKLDHATLVVDQNHRYPIAYRLETQKRYVRSHFRIPLNSIISQETPINNPIHIEAEVMGEILEFNIGRKKKRRRPGKYSYVPITGIYFGDKALFVRGNVNQNYTLVVRDKDPAEYEKEFQVYEKGLRSFFMYHMGRIRRRIQRLPVNLYFEKNSMKAEEGTYEIFENAWESKHSENYFILDRHSPQWEELSKHPGVVAKYSGLYYQLLYRADCFISTETPSHLNVHRAINPYVRMALLDKKFVFLQHGVTYLKCQGAGSVFRKGHEGEPDLVMVGSEKEAEAISGMLHIPKERCCITGLPIFSLLEYKHIREQSEDIVSIMLTWRPSEEHMLTHFEDSSYYRKVWETYQMLVHCMPLNCIRIVPHPKVLNLLRQTDLSELVWAGAVSQALKTTKLLITDYSSVCYDAFYQGAAVVFYQPDREDYEKEVGRLVPKENEYIGYRVFDLDGLKRILDWGIRRGHIDLGMLRTDEFEARYDTINWFHDGKNIQRITELLTEEKII